MVSIYIYIYTYGIFTLSSKITYLVRLGPGMWSYLWCERSICTTKYPATATQIVTRHEAAVKISSVRLSISKMKGLFTICKPCESCFWCCTQSCTSLVMRRVVKGTQSLTLSRITRPLCEVRSTEYAFWLAKSGAYYATKISMEWQLPKQCGRYASLIKPSKIPWTTGSTTSWLYTDLSLISHYTAWLCITSCTSVYRVVFLCCTLLQHTTSSCKLAVNNPVNKWEWEWERRVEEESGSEEWERRVGVESGRGEWEGRLEGESGRKQGDGTIET